MGGTDYYKDKISLVTGANSGIGYALTEELLKRGAIVYMAGRNPDKIEKAAKNLSKYRDSIHTVIVDVTVQEQVKKAIQGTAEETGRLDFLFNNAGIFKPMLFENARLEDWKIMINTNLWSVIYGVHTALPIMLKQGSGHIINTASLAGLVPYPMQVIYDTTKYAVVGLSESLRYEYAEKDISFSVICPGDINTPIFSKVVDSKGIGADIPQEAHPVDEAVSYCLDQVSKHKGRIIVPEKPNSNIYGGYILGNEQVEEFLLKHAHEHRIRFEKEGRFI
ncbi:MAG: SDR family oxidoreductase [Methanobacterium sp.]|nr:SDR family oxidoreductase [Methanobacterium sp.]